jgi:hypothetical protein
MQFFCKPNYLRFFIHINSPFRLSDRNCIEIVNKLLDYKLLDVVYTTDGKEYLTPQEITKEIREELVVQGGEIS